MHDPDAPLTYLLTCGHTYTAGDPASVTHQEVGKMPPGMTAAEAWAEVERLRAAPSGRA